MYESDYGSDDPAYAALGLTNGNWDANTLLIGDAALTANKSDIDGNLAFRFTGTKTITLADSTLTGGLKIANEAGSGMTVTLNAQTSRIDGGIKAYTGYYLYTPNNNQDSDTLSRNGARTDLNLGTLGGTLSTAGTYESITNVTVAKSTGNAETPDSGEIRMTGGALAVRRHGRDGG